MLLLDLFLDVLDEIDDPKSESSKLIRHQCLASLGHDRIGDRMRISQKDIEGWFSLYRSYREGDPTIRTLLIDKTYDLIFRSFTTKTAESLFDKLSKRWGI